MSLNGHFQGLEDGCGSASIPISFQRSIILESAVHFLPYPKHHKSTFYTEYAGPEHYRCGGASTLVAQLRTSIILARRVLVSQTVIMPKLMVSTLRCHQGSPLAHEAKELPTS